MEGQPFSVREAVLFTLFGYFLVPQLIGLFLRRAMEGAGISYSSWAPLVEAVSEAAVLIFCIYRLKKAPSDGLLRIYREEGNHSSADFSWDAPNAAGKKKREEMGTYLVCPDACFSPVFPMGELDFTAVIRVILLAFFGFDAANGIASLLVGFFENQSYQQAILKTSENSPGAGAPFVLTLLAYGIMAPVFEEVLIRGILYRGIRSRSGFWTAALLSSVLWSLSHIAVRTVILTFLAGFIFSLVYEKYRKLWIPILLHVGNNILSLQEVQKFIPPIRKPDLPEQMIILLLAEVLISIWLFKKICDNEKPLDGKTPLFHV
ncbi:MAG: CPBP family intramembrane metalloprotease [Eubacteriales bacterium]|nr:CPBP family intramembrane metalloprotease [Eubacteriales bacterium]